VQLAADTTSSVYRVLRGDDAGWDLDRVLQTRLIYAVEVLNWNYAAAHREKNAPYPPEPELILPPWEQAKRDAERVKAGVVDMQAQSGKKRIGGRTRMSIEQMKKRLGW
jgi:hypothetical protein